MNDAVDSVDNGHIAAYHWCMETKTLETIKDVERVIFKAIKAEFDRYEDEQGNPPSSAWLASKASEYGDVSADSTRVYLLGDSPALETTISMYMLALNLGVWDNHKQQFVDHTKVNVRHLIPNHGRIRNLNRIPSIDNRILFKSIYGVWWERYCTDGEPYYAGLVNQCMVHYPRIRFAGVQEFLQAKVNPREPFLNVLMLALNLDIRPLS